MKKHENVVSCGEQKSKMESLKLTLFIPAGRNVSPCFNGRISGQENKNSDYDM